MKRLLSIVLLLSVILCFSACGSQSAPAEPTPSATESNPSSAPSAVISVDNIPEYTNIPYVVINGNIPEFSEAEKKPQSLERYSELDSMGRCGIAFACIGTDIMPTEERGSIGQVKPTGWHTVKYDHVDGKYLYNRCHLIGYQLTGENANVKNLITGTRYMNVEGMLPFENMVADYVKETGNHVLYRVTPVFKGDELLCRGVVMEALSLEDDGEGIAFNVFVYNVQPKIVIDYKTGSSYESGEPTSSNQYSGAATVTFVLNTNTKKYHRVDCSSVLDMNPNNKKYYTGPFSGLEGYSPCGICKPQEASK